MTVDTPSSQPLAGGCRCKHVRFRLEAAPIITHACHCHLCQKVTGAPFCVVAMIETDRLTVLEGNPQPFHAKGCQKVMQCPACLARLWSYHPSLGEAIAFVGVGMLDDGEHLPPEVHYFTRSKHPWVSLPPGAQAFDELGDPGKPSADERINAALARSGANPSNHAFTSGA